MMSKYTVSKLELEYYLQNNYHYFARFLDSNTDVYIIADTTEIMKKNGNISSDYLVYLLCEDYSELSKKVLNNSLKKLMKVENCSKSELVKRIKYFYNHIVHLTRNEAWNKIGRGCIVVLRDRDGKEFHITFSNNGFTELIDNCDGTFIYSVFNDVYKLFEDDSVFLSSKYEDSGELPGFIKG